MTIHLRADRMVFRFSGADAHKLLNDVVTGHIPDNDDGQPGWWALLSPQGKVLAEGLAGWAEEALWLDVHRSVADDFFKRMRMYRLRAQVVIEDLRDTHAVGWSDVPAPGISHHDRIGPVEIGHRIIAPLDAATDWTQDDTAYARMRIGAGIAQLGQDFPADSVFAHDIGMDILGGIDFDKGCYVGQEVVSRMKHRGTARRRPMIVGGVTAEAGTPVLAGGRDSGFVGRVVDGMAVGIVRLDRFGPGTDAVVGGNPVTLERPGWANYTLGEASSEDAAI